MNRIRTRIPKSWILLAVFIVSVVSVGAWVFTTPPDGKINQSGIFFGNSSITAYGVTSNNVTTENLHGDVNGNVNVSGTNVTNATNLRAGASYIVYLCFAGTSVCAENGSTRNPDYIGAFPSVVNSALSHGGLVKVIGAFNNIDFTSTININNGNTLDLTGATLTISSISAPPITVNSGGVLLGGTIDANSVSALNGGSWHYLRVEGGTVDSINISNASLGMGARIGTNGSTIKNSVFISNAGNTQPAIWFATSVGYSDIMYNKVFDGWYDGIYASNNSKIIGNTVSNITHGGIYAPNLGQDSADISFNTVYNNRENGIDINTSHTTVYGNIVYNNSWNGIAVAGYNNTVSNNVVFSNNRADTGKDGIRLQSWSGLVDTSYNTISNNVIYDPSTTQAYAIGESNSGGTAGYPDYNLISGNTVVTGKTGIFKKVGAYTNIKDNPGGADEYNISTTKITATSTITANGLMYSGVLGSLGGAFLAYSATGGRYTSYQGTGISGTGGLLYTDAAGTSSNQDYIIRSTDTSGTLTERMRVKSNTKGAAAIVLTNITIKNGTTYPSGATMYSPDGTAYCFTIANGGTTNVVAGGCS